MTSLLNGPPAHSALRRALRRAADGVSLDAVEAETLLHARGDDLVALCASAARVRDAGLAAAGRTGVVTYSRKVFVPLTRLCRDRCHYCTFATVPHRLDAAFLSPDEVLDIARSGSRAGCKEALFTLGDRPEERWPAAREWLESRGYDSTLAYLRAMAVLVLEETGLLPHLNPGVMSWQEMARLRPVAASMGMMLETTSRSLFADPGGVHFGSPDKDPAVRLRVLADSGRLAVPFTTGVLVGIGETYADRVESLRAIRSVAREFGHVQEVLVQNFRSKPDTAMRHVDDLPVQDHLATIAVARLLLGPSVRVQVPPNLSEPDQVRLLLGAGADDWGGVSPVTADHVNPERPWPSLDVLARLSSEAGFVLRERLAVQPEWAREPWVDPRVVPHVSALRGPDGLADPHAAAVGRPWQEPDREWGSTGRVDLASAVDTEGRRTQRRGDFSEVYGNWSVLREKVRVDQGPAVDTPGMRPRAPERLDADMAAALRSAERDPADLTDAQAVALAQADGPALRALVALADAVRRDAVGDTVTYVVTRNLNFTNVCYTGCRFCAFAQRRTDADAFTLSLDEVGDRVDDAVAAGASEICMQGGIHPDLPGTAYLDLAREVKRRAPHIHLHAFSPMEVVNGATRTGLSIREFLLALREVGVGSIPGTAAEILDDDVRWVLTKGKLPTATWVEVVSTAHEVGLRSSSTMMYGHVDQPRHWVAHLRTLARIQARTGGFTEFVALPFVHQSSPIYLAGIARPGPSARDNLAVHALARLMLHGLVPNIQTSWVKLGVDGTRAMLQAGANDLGGTLMEETISRMAGSQHGSSKTPEQLVDIAQGIGRPVRERTTTYGTVDRARLAVLR